MGSISNRLKEPSTWAGLAILLSMLGAPVAPEQLQALMAIAGSVAAGAAVLIPETKPAKLPETKPVKPARKPRARKAR